MRIKTLAAALAALAALAAPAAAQDFKLRFATSVANTQEASYKEMEAFDRSVDLRIVRLRRKIEVDPAVPQVIKTVRGAGYVFATRDR